MYDIRSIECGAAKDQESCVADGSSQCGGSSSSSSGGSICSGVGGNGNGDSMSLTTIRRRRLFHRQACILSVLVAFAFGLALGVFVPLFGLGSAWFDDELHSLITTADTSAASTASVASIAAARAQLSYSRYEVVASDDGGRNRDVGARQLHPAHFPTIYDIRSQTEPALARPVSQPNGGGGRFVAADGGEDVRLPVETVFRNAFYLEEHKGTDTMTVKKLDAVDGTIKEFDVQRLADGLFRKSAERRLSKPSPAEEILQRHQAVEDAGESVVVEFVPHNSVDALSSAIGGAVDGAIIERDIYWGADVEQALPSGFSRHQTDDWNAYLRSGVVAKMEPGCGRMQNRMVTFQDGTVACARYRQNTDQIQGELFSFYLGRLLNITNLAPSGASIIDMASSTWQLATGDILAAQWKNMKPVVLTKWLKNLEPAGIPQPFQPLERHLNKQDVRNITETATTTTTTTDDDGDRNDDDDDDGNNYAPNGLRSPALERLVELAQWSDLIVFDYLIANLDRVVNNLYNYQWNADIMAAPAHNLARQRDTALLVFLDNESGLLHGYRLLKKYEAYHGLLLDNLCVFRRPTIDALRQLRTDGVGARLQSMFESTTSNSIREVLPPLPDKSITILNDRIDRVLDQVQKCRDLFSS